jgi:hypothetical protein
MVLQCCQYVNKITDEFTLEDMSYGEQDLKKCGLDTNLIQMMISFGKTMISLNLSKEELVLTYALIVYCEDRPNLTQGQYVCNIQEKYAFLLQNLMALPKNSLKRNGKNVFPEVIFLLSQARLIVFKLRPVLQSLIEQFGESLPELMRELIL